MNNLFLIWTWCLLGTCTISYGQHLDLVVDEPIERYELSVENYGILPTSITFGPLIEGHTYSIQSTNVSQTYFFESQLAYPTFDRAVTGFIAESSSKTIYLWRPYGEVEEPIHISLADLTTLHQPIGLTAKMMGPIEVQADTNATQLVDAIFNNQSCFETFNADFEGVYSTTVLPNGDIDTVSQLGFFTSGTSSVGFESGIILSSGRVRNAEGPNESNFRTRDYNNTSTDADMLILSGGLPIHDMAVLEFEFRPTSDSINFDYVFASEEYCEAFNDTNTDIFAFFISGPGINGPFSDNAENIAVLPDGSTQVKVNTVNHVDNANFFRNNVNPDFFLNCDLTDPVALNDIGYDGMTTILTARADVIPCETYKLRMVVADVGDGFFDSAVMLVNGTFAAGLVNPEPLGLDVDTSATIFDRSEGCEPFELALNRLNPLSTTDSVVVRYSIGTSSTATHGDDYTVNQDSIVILPGQQADTLIFDILNDGLVEGVEEIIIQLEGTCNCDQNRIVVRIADVPQFNLDIDAPGTGCAGDEIELAPMVSGGFPGYTYLWEDGSTDSLRTITTSTDTAEYCVTITDVCGFQDSVCVEVFRPAVSAQINGSFSLCNGPVTIPVLLSGGSDFMVTVLEDGLPQVYTSSTDTLFLTYSSPVSLSLLDVEADACPGTVSGMATVTTNTFDVSASLVDPPCFGESTGSIDLDVNGDPSQFTYQWSDASLTGPNPTELPADTYDLRIIDGAGCFTDTSFTLTQPATSVSIELDSLRDQDCLQNGFLSVFGSGGTGALSFIWQDGTPGPDRQNLSSGSYTAIAQDENGCTDSLDLQIADLRTAVIASIDAPTTQLDCQTNSILLVGADNPSQSVEYQWTDQNGNPIGNDPSFDATQAGTYTLTVTNPQNGCTDSEQIDISQSDDLPVLSVVDSGLLTCTDTNIDIEIGINITEAVNYSWTGPSGPIVNNSPLLANVSEPGTYTVEAIQQSNQCAATLNIEIDQDITPPSATITVDGLINCRDSSTIVRATPNADFSYAWSTTNGNVLENGDAANATVIEGDYNVLVTDQSNGCEAIFSTSVLTDFRTLTAEAGSDQLLPCNDPSFRITGSALPNLGGTAFNWFDPDGNQVSGQADFLPQGIGTYRLEVTHPETFCTSSDFVEVTSEGPVGAELDITTPPCPEVGGRVFLETVIGGTGPYTLDFDGGIPDTLLSNAWTNVAAGTYPFTITDQNGCQFSSQLVVPEGGIFTGTTQVIETTINEPAQLGAEVNRTDSEIVSWNWTVGPTQQLSCDDCPNPVASSTESFTALVQIVDIFGCQLELRQQVIVDTRQFIFAPNAFSPGIQDGINDRFTLFGPADIVDAIESITIFNRWGTEVWTGEELEINNPSQGWDGQFNNKPMGAQVLVYVARVRLFDGSIQMLTGDFTLLR